MKFSDKIEELVNLAREEPKEIRQILGKYYPNLKSELD
jgi:hypothetical protein